VKISSLRSRLWQGMGVNGASGAFQAPQRMIPHLKQEKPTKGFSGRFMKGCYI